MHKWITFYSLFLCAGLALLITSCAQPPRTALIKPVVVAENPAEEVNRFDSAVSIARNQQMHILAPLSFEKAERHLHDAKDELARGGKLSEIRSLLTKGGKALDRAEKDAEFARSFLSDTIEARRLAREAGAVRFTKDYAAVERNFITLTQALEQNNREWVKGNRSPVSEAFRQLELRAIKEQTLGEVRRLLNLADEAGAKKIVPITFAAAKQSLKDADDFISEKRYEQEMIHKKAAKALFDAQRLNAVMALANDLREKSPEEISLSMEKVAHDVMKQLSGADIRNQSFNVQVNSVLSSISALQNDRQFMVEKVKAGQEELNDMNEKMSAQIKKCDDETGILNTRIALLEGRSKESEEEKMEILSQKRAIEEEFERERQFNKLYDEVQTYFTEDEAEIYKRGHQLVIRLINMHFPVGQSIIMPENYQLLSKVQRAVRTFKEPEVIIEGHTDSTGTDEVNELLSRDRAEAVRDYLVANKTLGEDKIVAVGFGSKRPVASNATEEGRAMNRRIDVIITPNPPTGQ
jgi:OOP family OmpA-OmpF porin